MQPDQVFASIAAFFDQQFLSILIATILLFLLVFLIWTVYRTLSKRDIFRFNMRLEHAKTKDFLVHAAKYFILFPLYIFLGFLIFAFSLFLLIKPTLEQETLILFMAIVLVSTIRIAAYVHEHLAEDLAKAIPLTVLVVLLTSANISSLGIPFEEMAHFITQIPGFLKYLIFTIMLEAVLRGGTWLLGNLGKEEKE
jgi:hypothetical protein